MSISLVDGRYLLDGKVSCIGLHSFLEQTLYPNYVSTYSQAAAMAARSYSSKSQASKRASKARGKPKTQGHRVHEQRVVQRSSEELKTAAKERGCLVDDELKEWTEGFQRHASSRHEFTNVIIEAFGKWNLKPVEAQGHVAIPESRAATTFDLLMKDKEGRNVYVEVKTGYEGYFGRHNGQTLEHNSLKKVPSSPQTHAILQAAMTAKYIERSRGMTIDQVYVVRAYSRGCTRIVVRTNDAKKKKKVPKWLPSAMKVMEAALYRRRSGF